MAHRLGRHEDAGEALIRLVLEDLAEATRDCRGAGAREIRIHRIRQRLKRVRTVLRVLEPAFGDRIVLIRRDLAAVARLLAGARDADVAAANAHTLAATAAPGEDIGLKRVAAALDEEAAQAHREAVPTAAVSRQLAAATAAVSTLDTSFDGDALIEQALSRAYASGRKSMRRARTSLSTPDLHRWRKSVKQLWYLIRLDRKRLAKAGRRIAPDLERLGEVLGSDNDHALLAEKIALSPSADLSLMAQLSLIAKRRNALEAEAFDIGEKIYRRRPRKFARAAAGK